jgi:hypothetical protein
MSRKVGSSSSSSSSKAGVKRARGKNSQDDGIPAIHGDNDAVITAASTSILADLTAFLAPATLDLKGAFKVIFMLDCLERKTNEAGNVAILSELVCVEATFQSELMKALNKDGKLEALRAIFETTKANWLKGLEVDGR